MSKAEIDQHRVEQKSLAIASLQAVMDRFPELSAEQAAERIRQAKAFVSALPRNPLQEEVDERRMRPDLWQEMTMAQLVEQLAKLGYKLDRSADCAHVARWMSGPRAGESYPSVSMRIVQADDGLCFANVDARRDARFKELQETIRSSVYVIGQNALYEP